MKTFDIDEAYSTRDGREAVAWPDRFGALQGRVTNRDGQIFAYGWTRYGKAQAGGHRGLDLVNVEASK